VRRPIAVVLRGNDPAMFESMPIFGVCGYSGSGKTTLLQQILPRLLNGGLRVAVVKHDVHGIATGDDCKDSERLFDAGADVIVRGPGESLGRYRNHDDIKLHDQLVGLVEHYDLVLLEGFKQLPCRKVWLLKDGETSPAGGIGNCEAVLPWDADRVTMFQTILSRFLDAVAGQTSVFGCILIGGRSRRMGRPKHLLPCAKNSRETWLDRTLSVLEPVCERVIFAGAGVVPEDMSDVPRIDDSPSIGGPMAGLLSAMRWAPRAEFLLVACDLPRLSQGALQWVLDQRSPGVWAVLPQLPSSSHIEPLLAWYDFRCRPVLESMAASGCCKLKKITQHPKARVVTVSEALTEAWSDADMPQEADRWIEDN